MCNIHIPDAEWCYVYFRGHICGKESLAELTCLQSEHIRGAESAIEHIPGAESAIEHIPGAESTIEHIPCAE
jgi:hypothetical protein